MSKALAAMLAESDMGSPDEMDMGSMQDDPNLEAADEGQMVAAEEIMQAFHDHDTHALLGALRSFIRMAN